MGLIFHPSKGFRKRRNRGPDVHVKCLGGWDMDKSAYSILLIPDARDRGEKGNLEYTW